MAKRNNKIENEYAQFSSMSPEFVHSTGETLKQQIGELEIPVDKISALIENLSAEIGTLSKSDKEEDKKSVEAKTAKKESLSKALEAAKKKRDEQKPKLEKKLARVQGFEKNKVQIEKIRSFAIKINKSKAILVDKKAENEKAIKVLENEVAKIDNDLNNKLDKAELEKMEKSDIKFFYAEDFARLDELKEKVAAVDEKKKSITDKINSLKNANKEIDKKIETINTEISKCDFAWKNLFLNKTWDEIEAKSMDGRFTKKQEKAKVEEPEKKAEEPAKEESKAPVEEQPAKEESKAPAEEQPAKEESKVPGEEQPAKKEQKQEAPAEAKPNVTKQIAGLLKGSYEKAKSILKGQKEEMWTDLISEEEAKKEEAENAKKEEKGLTKTSRWSKILNAIKHPIQTIKNTKAAKTSEIAKETKQEEPAKTEEQKGDAFIAKLRKMAEAEEAKQSKANSQEKPDYSKYVARHARNVEKRKDDEGR